MISSPQSAAIKVPQGEVINFCANNYLGLADNPEIIAMAQRALDERGFGMASVRFICGTHDLHKELERIISDFNGTDDTILYSSCFDANAGLFETILGADDAIISDQLNHASIIDGVRLCKAERFRYANSDMDELEEILKKTEGHRRRLIATDGVFSMDGYLVKLDRICDLAEIATTPWSWWTTPTPPAISAPPAEEPRKSVGVVENTVDAAADPKAHAVNVNGLGHRHLGAVRRRSAALPFLVQPDAIQGAAGAGEFKAQITTAQDKMHQRPDGHRDGGRQEGRIIGSHVCGRQGHQSKKHYASQLPGMRQCRE